MSSEVCDICILVLIGVPGCGKTSFCQNYQAHLESQKLNLVHVCYDDLILRERQAELATNNDEHGKWKLERNDIVTAVDVLISEMKGTNIASVDRKVKNLVAKIPKPDQHSGRIVVVIDDNNYLPSMRHQYYQLARKHLTGFCQVYFHCQRETAKLLNGGRKKEDQVPEHVIDQINDKMEEPNPLKNNWECFSFSISIEATEIPKWNFEMVDNVVNLGFGNPVQPYQDNTEEREAARVICSASLVHQVFNFIFFFNGILSQYMLVD